MAADYPKMSDELRRFYDFTGKVVLFIGAAGRQLLDPSIPVKKLVAIDKDVNALQALRAHVMAQGLADRVDVVGGSALKRSPRRAMSCTSSSACTRWTTLSMLCSMPSRWLLMWWCMTTPPDQNGFITAPRKTKSRAAQPSCRSLASSGDRPSSLSSVLPTTTSLYAKVAPQGPLAIERVQRFAGHKSIVIPFHYELNLL